MHIKYWNREKTIFVFSNYPYIHFGGKGSILGEKKVNCSLPTCFDVADSGWNFQGSSGWNGYHYSSSQKYLKWYKVRISLYSAHRLAAECHRRERSLAAVCADAKYTKNVAILKGSFCKKNNKVLMRNPLNLNGR